LYRGWNPLELLGAGTDWRATGAHAGWAKPLTTTLAVDAD
jgi:hypothetical protein